MEKLRIDNGKKKIEVNDNGDYIEFSVGDYGFIEEFGKFAEWMQQQENNKMEPSENTVDGAMEMLRKKKEICQEACKRIDKLFGEGTCKKVFGDISPDEYMIAEFAEAILALMNKFGKERKQSIGNKYSSDRKGANSK